MQSIYEEIGGAEALTCVVDDFYKRVLADARLAGYFRRTDLDRLKRSQVAFFTAALGGPQGYTGLSMADAHRGRHIGRRQFDRAVGHLADALDAAGVVPDTVTAVVATLEPLAADIVTT
ncbi:group 1 truncated hemoglobin [Rhodococcus sp. D2-41]|nr:group 1 truncated hemoglobin [Rhodococcus sp. D2-41]